MSKKIILFTLITMLIMLIIPSYNVSAKTLGDLKNELADLEKKYETAKNNKNLTKDQIDSLTSEINTITANLNAIKSDIAKTEQDIQDNEKQIEEKRKETDELLKFLQVSSGENVYLEYIFEADSYTDFIYRYSVVSQLTEYNNNLMEELKSLVSELETKKTELNTKQANLQNTSSELNSKLVTLRTSLAGYEEEGTTVEQDIADMKKEIKRYEDKGCKNNENILTCGQSSGTIINATGWNYPLTWGCVTSEYTGYNIRDDWSGGGSHHGIDLDCVSEGTNVYAAANGVVARVVYRSSCGGNMVYVYHSVNGIPYTSVYMHLLYINVSENQVVTPTTVIGGVGGGSTSSYDNCTSGAHLHFGLAYGHNAYSFNSNSFNPRNLFNFPSLIYSGGGYFRR
ncbi:MAG: coiled-coil domain-containing protein [Bacilli bacterium]